MIQIPTRTVWTLVSQTHPENAFYFESLTSILITYVNRTQSQAVSYAVTIWDNILPEVKLALLEELRIWLSPNPVQALCFLSAVHRFDQTEFCTKLCKQLQAKVPDLTQEEVTDIICLQHQQIVESLVKAYAYWLQVFILFCQTSKNLKLIVP